MKKCAYCQAENRDEAIFCTRCRRPLQEARVAFAPRAVWVLLVLGGAILFLGSYLLSFRPSFAARSTPTSTEISGMDAMPTWTPPPVTRRTCVGEQTRIRRGPGTQYEMTGGLVSGICLTIIGRDEGAGWVYMVGDDGQTGWVGVSALPDAGDLSQVSIRDHAQMSSSTRPTLTSAEIAYGAQAYLTQVAATNMPGAPLSRYVEPCFQTARRTGEHISCRMERAYCDYLPARAGSPTLCSDRPAPDQTFTLIVFGQDWSEFDGQCLLVSGYLEISGGVLQVEALDRDQVSLCT